MATKLKMEWTIKLHHHLGYKVTEDEEDLRCLNRAIKGIIQSERQKWVARQKKTQKR
jgi:hypothetical protein